MITYRICDPTGSETGTDISRPDAHRARKLRETLDQNYLGFGDEGSCLTDFRFHRDMLLSRYCVKIANTGDRRRKKRQSFL